MASRFLTICPAAINVHHMPTGANATMVRCAPIFVFRTCHCLLPYGLCLSSKSHPAPVLLTPAMYKRIGASPLSTIIDLTPAIAP